VQIISDHNSERMTQICIQFTHYYYYYICLTAFFPGQPG